jgi:hypothetical protein
METALVVALALVAAVLSWLGATIREIFSSPLVLLSFLGAVAVLTTLHRIWKQLQTLTETLGQHQKQQVVVASAESHEQGAEGSAQAVHLLEEMCVQLKEIAGSVSRLQEPLPTLDALNDPLERLNQHTEGIHADLQELNISLGSIREELSAVGIRGIREELRALNQKVDDIVATDDLEPVTIEALYNELVRINQRLAISSAGKG